MQSKSNQIEVVNWTKLDLNQIENWTELMENQTRDKLELNQKSESNSNDNPFGSSVWISN